MKGRRCFRYIDIVLQGRYRDNEYGDEWSRLNALNVESWDRAIERRPKMIEMVEKGKYEMGFFNHGIRGFEDALKKTLWIRREWRK